MHTPFFITGYPRSRTAWLANLFTTDTTLCFHEPKETVDELMAQYPQYRIGVSSCMLVRDFFAITRQFPEAPWLYVERNKAEARASMLEFSKELLKGEDYDELIRIHFTASKIIKDDRRTMTVNFEEMNKYLPAIWNHLLPETPFSAIRAHLLTELKVEQRLKQAFNRFVKGREILWQQ